MQSAIRRTTAGLDVSKSESFLRFKNITADMSCTITEITGDLFAAPKDSSMAHCVAEDMRLGKGIAVKFKNLFGQIDKLKKQNAAPGEVALIKDKDRFIYYLVTKKLSYQKPTYQTMHSSLCTMRDHMKKHDITKLAIPRIGCGLDGLVWSKVKDQLSEVFQDEDVEITVYNYAPPK